jgi:hypothetical protein
MKKTLFFLLFFIGSLHHAKADTTDYWHIYFNDDRIKMCDALNPAELIFNANKIQATDSITVKPSKDAPCYDCKTMLYVENDKGILISTAIGKGTFNPITFSLKELAERDKNEKNYRVFYDEDNPKSTVGKTQKVFLFTIAIR